MIRRVGATAMRVAGGLGPRETGPASGTGLATGAGPVSGAIDCALGFGGADEQPIGSATNNATGSAINNAIGSATDQTAVNLVPPTDRHS